MRRFCVEEYGVEPALVESDRPSPARGEALIRIAACGLNFGDTLMVHGKYQERPTPPFTLGMELSGTIEALGPETEGPSPGTRVAVFAGMGGLADYGCFDVRRCIPLPESVGFIDAAALQVAYGTSHLALTRAARLKPGDRLVVTGAAGGVGLTAVELGAKLGAEVVAIARGAEKLGVARAAGAHHLIDAESDDIRGQLKALGGIDVAYDAVGGALFDACFRAARPEARLLVIGFAGGGLPELRPNHMLVKNVAVIGFYWGGYLQFAPEALTDSLATMVDWCASGRIAPHVGSVLPLDRAGEGLAMLRERRAVGKIVVDIAAG